MALSLHETLDLTSPSWKLNTSRTATRTPHFGKRFISVREKTKWPYFTPSNDEALAGACIWGSCVPNIRVEFWKRGNAQPGFPSVQGPYGYPVGQVAHWPRKHNLHRVCLLVATESSHSQMLQDPGRGHASHESSLYGYELAEQCLLPSSHHQPSSRLILEGTLAQHTELASL